MSYSLSISWLIIYKFKIWVAIDKNDKKPKTSVKVVNTIPEANAGSIFNLLMEIGIMIPTKQAKPKLISIANAMASKSWWHYKKFPKNSK